MKNFFGKGLEKIRRPVAKAAAVTGVMALGLTATAGTVEVQKKDTAPSDGIETTDTTLDPIKEYELHKQEGDESFIPTFMLDSIDAPDESVIVRYQGLDDVHIKVTHQGKEQKLTLEQFSTLYPQYRHELDTKVAGLYTKHVESYGAMLIFNRVKESLPQTCEHYDPSTKELEIMQKEVALFRSGGTTDGYDEIYEYYTGGKSKMDIVKFCLEKGYTPEVLAGYMQQHYFSAEVKK